MTLSKICCALLASAIIAAASLADDSLPRRGSLGLELGPAEGGGIGVTGVVPDGPAVGAGVQVGDVLVSVNGYPVNDANTLQAATAALASDEPARVVVRRGEDEVVIELTPTPVEIPDFPGAHERYGHVTLANGDRVRTITLIPEEASPLAGENGLPGVFYIQGIGCSTIDAFANQSNQRNRMLADLLRAGFVVGLADKPGLGDSEGVKCRDGGFHREVEAFRLAAQAFASSDAVDADRVYGVGVSMGGIQLPLIADTVAFDGIVTWGTGFSPWLDYLTTNFRWRSVMQGQDAAQTDPVLRSWRRVMSAILLQGMTPDAVEAALPQDFAVVSAAFGSIEHLAGRHYTFHQEIETVNLWAAWQSFDGALLALQGEFDWVADERDHRLAAEVMNLRRPGSAKFELVPGLDHGMTRHDTLAESFSNAFNGDPSHAFHDRAVAWLVETASR